jgi:MoaA/NifB/PqqE/SkfB family radical SAM enzyme
MPTSIKPKKLQIEGNASCQLRCPTCPTTSQGYPPVVGSGHLHLTDFKKILNDNPQIKNVQFENRGELFLNPELMQIIEYGFKKNIIMTANSGVNLNNVRKDVLEGLVKHRFKSMLCSIDGATPETYRVYRVGGSFNRVIKNIQIINNYKIRYRTKYPELTWQFVVFGHNEHEIPLAKEMAKSLNMSFKPKMSWDSEYSPVRNTEFVREQTGWPAVTREAYEEITNQNYSQSVCYSLWISPRINWDGKVLGCCWNSWADFGGNAFHDGYLSVINSDKISYARRMLLGRSEPKAGLPCTTCELYQKMRNSDRYLSEREIFDRHSLLYRGLRFLYHRISVLQKLRKKTRSSLCRSS